MKRYAATDWSIIREGKECAIFDRSTLQQVGPKTIHRLNKKYAFVFPEVLLMECAKAEDTRIVENIKMMEKFLIVSIRRELIMDSDLVPCSPHDIMKKDLGVSIVRGLEEDPNPVYFIPYDKDARIDLINWAKRGSADEFYKYYEDFAKMFKGKTPQTKNGVVEGIHLRGVMGGYKPVPKDKIEEYVENCAKAYREKYGFNPLYGDQLVDVVGYAKMLLKRTSIIEIINDLSEVFEFDPSWAIKRIEMRPNHPHPDDFAKYSYYFYFITMCYTLCGFIMNKQHLRDWQYLFYLPFCHFFTSDKRFFSKLREAMKVIKTDDNVGINISDRIHIWGEKSP